ncbi:MAG: DUF2288 domain-containing protein [Gammaproteobacteria bacterium]|jgi:hypothetical protein
MTADNDQNTNDELIFQKLNLETGKISWLELQRHFARGVVIIVAKDLDLVEVASHFSKDNKKAVQRWMDQGAVKRATDDDARQWHERQQDFWAVVTAPWVLVQPI